MPQSDVQRGSFLLLPLLTVLLVAPVAEAAQLPSGGVPAPLLSKLGRGANVTRWFSYQPDYTNRVRMNGYLNDKDAANFKRLGITWVRLCLSPDAVFGANGTPKAETMPYLDRAISWFRSQNMAVVLDLHDNGQLRLDTPGRKDADFVAFWRTMSWRYRGLWYDRIAFELVNEPVFEKNPEAWARIQDHAIAAIRAVDPKRTIMVSGTKWSGRDTLLAMRPLPQKNLLYTFHSYEPFWFTHQGATWAGELPSLLKGVPFPSTPQNVEPIAAGLPAPWNTWIRDYGQQRWDAEKQRAWIAEAAAWGKRNGVPVVLGEFGAYPPVSPPDSRERWFAGFREAVRASGLPNAIWGYDDSFGLGRSVDLDGTVRLDPMVERTFFGGK